MNLRSAALMAMMVCVMACEEEEGVYEPGISEGVYGDELVDDDAADSGRGDDVEDDDLVPEEECLADENAVTETVFLCIEGMT